MGASAIVRSAISCLIALMVIAPLLTACTATSRSKTTDPELSPVSQANMDALLAVREMRDRLVTVCSGVDPSQMTPNTSAFLGYRSDIKECVREKLTDAFANSEGTVYCADELDLGRYVVCIAFGDWLNMLRRGAGSPKLLSPDEWRESDRAVENTVKEVVVQAFAQCAGKSGQQSEDCKTGILVASFGVPVDDAAVCQGVPATRLQCLGYKATARYLRDKTMLIW